MYSEDTNSKKEKNQTKNPNKIPQPTHQELDHRLIKQDQLTLRQHALNTSIKCNNLPCCSEAAGKLRHNK